MGHGNRALLRLRRQMAKTWDWWRRGCLCLSGRRLPRGEQLPQFRQSVLHLLLQGFIGFALGGVTGFELLLLGADLCLQGVKACFVALDQCAVEFARVKGRDFDGRSWWCHTLGWRPQEQQSDPEKEQGGCRKGMLADPGGEASHPGM